MLVAIAGLKNSGKDTAAKMLQYCLSTPKFMHSYTMYKLLGGLIPKKYDIISFATPLKRTLAALLNVDVSLFDDRDFKERTYISFENCSISINPPTTIGDSKFNRYLSNKDFSFLKSNYISIRQLLQLFGTNVMRDIFGDKLWIMLTLHSQNSGIISDLRFKTELNAVKSAGGKVLYIKRDSCVPGNHASEREVIDMYNGGQFDYVIENNGTLKDMFNSINDNLS